MRSPVKASAGYVGRFNGQKQTSQSTEKKTELEAMHLLVRHWPEDDQTGFVPDPLKRSISL